MRSVPGGDSGGKYRAKSVFEHPEWLGREVVLDIYEPLRSSEWTTAAEDGELAVEVADVGTSQLTLSPARSNEEARAGALGALSMSLRPPVRVRGQLFRDDVREKRSGRIWRVLVAREIQYLEFPQPTRIPATSVILNDRKAWHGQYVEVESNWTSQFESSYIGHSVWLDLYPDAAIYCEPTWPENNDPFGLPEPRSARVRAVGFVHASSAGYGHLNGARAEIVATTVTYLEPRRPKCAR